MSSTNPTLPANRSMPNCTVIPVLYYPDVPGAADWLCRAFGFSERIRIGGHRVQLNVGQAAVVVAQGRAAATPTADPTHSIMVRVPDVDHHHRTAAAAGATILGEPTSYPYGERQYSVADVGGHIWTFSQTLADVDPDSWGGTLVVPRRPRIEFTTIREGALTIVEGTPSAPLLVAPGDLLEACFADQATGALLYASNLPSAFFDLSSGQAGAILQKMRNYGVRLAVVCQPNSVVWSSRFGEMVAEEQDGPWFRIFDTREAALKWLGG
jgi:uncharacterized glyoxalase superfamily protein PhnB